MIDGAGLIEGLVGSRVTIAGRMHEPLASAALHREGEPPQPMPLTNGGREFHAEFDIREPGLSWYWFDLTDEHGLSEPEPPRYELRGVDDRPPVVYIEEPAADLTVTPSADLPLRVIARDDLGLTELRLRHTDAIAPLDTADGDVTPAPDTPAAETVPLPLSAPRSVEEAVATTWRLGPLELSPGARLTYWAEAVDAAPSTPNTTAPPGRSGPARRHLDVISESDKQRELAVRQSGILETLDALHGRQAEARDITAQLRIQAELAQRLRPGDLTCSSRPNGSSRASAARLRTNHPA